MNQIILTVLLMFFWVALTQSLYWIDLIMGLVVSLFAVLLSNKLLSFNFKIRIKLIKLLKYIFILIPNIIISGVKSLYMIITFKTDVKIIKVDTILKHDFSIYILAVSITLTPGTITIYRDGSSLYVLRLYPKADTIEKEIKEIKAPFESILLED
ncbi:MAG: Na+/H+ antiporter subunit E [bacterium]